jgi:hypothetical protein
MNPLVFWSLVVTAMIVIAGIAYYLTHKSTTESSSTAVAVTPAAAAAVAAGQPVYTYRFYPNQDMRTNILLPRAYDKANDIEALKALCSAAPGCAGFSSSGALRQTWNPAQLIDMTVAPWSTDPAYQNRIAGITGAYQRLSA